MGLVLSKSFSKIKKSYGGWKVPLVKTTFKLNDSKVREALTGALPFPCPWDPTAAH